MVSGKAAKIPAGGAAGTAIPLRIDDLEEILLRPEVNDPCGLTIRSMLSNRLFNAFSWSEIIINCAFSPVSGLRWTQHMILNKPASENSIEPSSSFFSASDWKKAVNGLLLVFFLLAASAAAACS